MGRELRRVPMDFDWPLDKVWEGFLPPSWRECPADCVNGSTLEAAWVGTIVHLLLMTGEQSGRPLHPWLNDLPLRPPVRPGPRMAELTGGLAGRPPGVFGHDAIDRGQATAALFKAAGLPEDWGTCQTCQGHAIHPDDLAASEAWVDTPPPTGDGFQLWETTSEGSPQSPVFATLEELCRYAEDHCTTFADNRTTAEGWAEMLSDGMVTHREVMPDGTTAVFL